MILRVLHLRLKHPKVLVDLLPRLRLLSKLRDQPLEQVSNSAFTYAVRRRELIILQPSMPKRLCALLHIATSLETGYLGQFPCHFQHLLPYVDESRLFRSCLSSL